MTDFFLTVVATYKWIPCLRRNDLPESRLGAGRRGGESRCAEASVDSVDLLHLLQDITKDFQQFAIADYTVQTLRAVLQIAVFGNFDDGFAFALSRWR